MAQRKSGWPPTDGSLGDAEPYIGPRGLVCAPHLTLSPSVCEDEWMCGLYLEEWMVGKCCDWDWDKILSLKSKSSFCSSVHLCCITETIILKKACLLALTQRQLVLIGVWKKDHIRPIWASLPSFIYWDFSFMLTLMTLLCCTSFFPSFSLLSQVKSVRDTQILLNELFGFVHCSCGTLHHWTFDCCF